MTNTNTPAPKKKLTPLRCFISAIVAGGIAYALYGLTTNIAAGFAARGVQSDNTIVIRLSAAFRTMVIGGAALGTGIFAMATIGLIGLGIQILLEQRDSSMVD
jgi:hypothetical protein